MIYIEYGQFLSSKRDFTYLLCPISGGSLSVYFAGITMFTALGTYIDVYIMPSNLGHLSLDCKKSIWKNNCENMYSSQNELDGYLHFVKHKI